MTAPDPAAYAAVTEFLFAQKAREGSYGIDRMTRLAAALGNPERAVPCVHVAGTNGKGSVAAMIAAILQSAGLRAGLYTSPHLVKLNERVRVDGRMLDDREVVDFTAELRPMAEQLAAENAASQPSFFEYMTAMALLQFARKSCDLAVLEVGLGGRLDATNIVTPEVSVITSIGLDHCEMLGNTIELIAAEKAGIVKRGRPVVLGCMPPTAEATIRRIANERDARVISVREECGDDLAKYPATNLEGDYQRRNAATAALAVRALRPRWKVEDAAIARGLMWVVWPGRWQSVRVGGRRLILDASHNPEGAQVLDRNLGRLVAEIGRRPVVIVGALGRDRAQPLIAAICRHAKDLYLVVPNEPRACTYAELEALVPAEFTGRIVRSEVAALFPVEGVCTAGAADDVVVVTGSIYLLGEAISRLAPASMGS